MRIRLYSYDMLNVYTVNRPAENIASETLIEYWVSPRIRSGAGAILGFARHGAQPQMPTIVVLSTIISGYCSQIHEYNNTEYTEACEFLMHTVRTAMADVGVHHAVRDMAQRLYNFDIRWRV